MSKPGGPAMRIHDLHLRVDQHDWRAIEAAMVRRASWGIMPDILHDDTTMTGRLLGEICRGWMDLHDEMDAKRKEW